jgi:pyruvate kinase
VKKKEEKMKQMIDRIGEIIDKAKAKEEKLEERLKKVHRAFAQSARNLVHYRTLRTFDIRELQEDLGNMCLSRLAKTESHVLASLETNKAVLESFFEGKPAELPRCSISPKKSARLLRSNAKDLLGYRSKGRRTRIMVTLPGEAADDYRLVRSLIERGMNCARINCAHDGPEAWKKMIDHVRKASAKLKRHCKVTMDLGGPKIRTGELLPGPKVFRYRPPKDIRGNVIKPIALWLSHEPHSTDFTIPHIPVSLKDMKGVQEGDCLYFRDARNKKRKLAVTGVEENGYLAECARTIYLESGLLLYRDKGRKGPDTVQVGELPALERPIVLFVGDFLRLHRENIPGEPARYDDNGNLLQMAHVSCTAPEVFLSVQPGEPILFDDGKIAGVIREVNEEELITEIVYAQEAGAKLGPDKGINFPGSRLKISGLTEKDRQDLEFIARYADVVNMSFVNTPQDVRDLIAEIDRLGSRDRLGIILKIETQRGYNNLTDILLEAMQVYPIGVMIARGDLAIECGWDNIGRLQTEIMSLCQAAHIPDIWATQVLENLAKKGLPSRAEITDAVMAQRAECVMLNKGDYILDAINLLDTILKDMEPYQEKNAPMTPALEIATFEEGMED